MKKIYGTTRGALLALAVAATSILTMVGCGESATDAGYNNVGYGGYNNGYGYGYGTGYYPYNNRYLLMRSNQQGQTEYANVDQPLNSQSDVAKYHKSANFQPMNRNQAIDQQNGYQNVDNNSDGMYFVQHNPSQYKDPYQSGQRQSTYWYYNYRYSCGGGYNVGYWGYRGACGYNNWNHIYAPYYNYGWYNNWYWRPTYYNANNFWYYAPGWSSAYWYGGYQYTYFWIP